MSFLATATKKNDDADEKFGQHIVASLHKIKDEQKKEYLKLKIQELIYSVQFDMPQTTWALSTACSSKPVYRL